MQPDYDRVESAIRYIADHADAQPGLEEIAREVGLSPFHFQRLFRRWAGVSPKRFLQTLTVEHAKSLLAESASVLDAAYETGLSGPSRLHDHFVAVEAMTPGEFKRRGAGLEIRWGVHASPFGRVVIATTGRGVCGLSFAAGEPRQWLRREWPEAELVEDRAKTRALAGQIFEASARVPLHVEGTSFQLQVWRALLRIPAGHLRSYDQVARAVGRPGAARAVGSAVGANRIAYLIPCHRVIRASGSIGGYRWGGERKQAMIAWEQAHAAPAGAAGADGGRVEARV